jgi:hypothetical protein
MEKDMYVKKRDGSAFYNNRPLYQLEQKSEKFLPELKTKIDIAEYPLHFIDFETYNMSIPLHENMVPYENIMFQWSCHTISHPGAKPMHTEWLNTIDIRDVMNQYEIRYKDFEFIGPVPIDFDTVLGFGQCVINELCKINIEKLRKFAYKNGTARIQIKKKE